MSDLEIKNTLDAVNKQLKKANDELLPKAEDALKKASNAQDLSNQTKSELDKLITATNSLEVAKNDLETRLGEAEQIFARHKNDGIGTQVHKTAGQIVAEHEALPAFAKGIQAGQKLRIPVGNAITSPDLPDGVVPPQRLSGIQEKPKQRLFIRDLIAPGQTESPAIFWVQEGGFVNNAAVVPEGTTKPYSDMEFETQITAVATIAHMFKTSKQVLDDFKQLMSKIDVEMRFGLKQKEEQEILFGNGVGSNLHGIMPQAQDFKALFKPEATTNIDLIRLAMLQGRLARMPATGTVMDFLEWAKIELTKNSLGNYIIANPMGFVDKTLWGLPVVDTDAPEFLGKFLTGAFAYGAQIFDREEANVVISTENTDDFEKNMISIRCEERLALAVQRPEAFVKGEFTTALAAVKALS